jgi:enamine deaminase RidA (YjgF/YER057c/UK114 family)
MTRLAITGLALAALLPAAAPAAAQQLERVNPPGLSTPQTYTHVVKVGKLLFIAGQVGADASGKVVGPGMREQLERVLENLKIALASQGADFRHVAKITVFVTSIDEYRAPGMAELRGKYFGDHRPASTLVQVASLANPAFKVEIEAVAALP